ncbi:hypothetical protein [Mycobacterium sp. D16R24]|uniref:hypothetical protein n=1 Tax=Mycobacterium sp. D16R24 TaxID=1855656 RepID=UPI000992A819|nr:hypothetical protein [Mycobacterium sp. D16R24]
MPAVKSGPHQPLQYDTLKDSRAHLSDVIDTAQDGLLVSLRRGRSNRDLRAGSVAVVKTTVLRDLLERIVADSVEVDYNSGEGLYTAALRGLPLAAEGESLSDVFDDLVDEIRDYAEDWVSRLRFAPNHEGNVPIVYLAQTMSDDELHGWLMTQAGD